MSSEDTWYKFQHISVEGLSHDKPLGKEDGIQWSVSDAFFYGIY